MFWSSTVTSSTIDTILDEPDITLQKVLDQDDVLQELRAQNKKLVEFLSRTENMNGMLDLVTSEPPQDLPLAAQYKLANVACEVLTCDNSFGEKITGERAFLEKLFFFFRDKQSPINPLLASYVCRIIGEIITRKHDQNWYSYQLNIIQIMGYLQSETGIIQWLLNHMDCSAVCELFYKLIMNVEGQDMRNSLYQWLVGRERVILRLLEKMTRAEAEDVHANVSRLVGDLLYAFLDELMNSNQERASTDADPFLQALRSYESISTLLKVVFAPNAICETSVMHGLDLLLALLGITRRSPRQSGRNDSLDEDNDGILFTEAIKNELLAVMPILLKLLESPVDPYSIPLTSGILEKPVGLGRLSIAKFIAHLFTLNDDQLNMGMIESGVLKQLLDLFWENPWNNFLHRYVCTILACVAKASNASPGSASYLMDIGILSKILEVFEKKELKCGYRGHLAKVASVWGEAAQSDGNLKDLMKALETTDEALHVKWDIFYGDTLESYLSEENVLLAGVHPPAGGGLTLSSTNASSMPYEESDNPSSSSMWDGRNAMAMAANIVGLDFDSISDTFNNLTIDGSGSSVGDDFDQNKSRSIFEMFCVEKSSHLDDDDEEEDGDGEKKTKRKKKDRFDDLGSPNDDEDDEDDSLDDEMRWTDANEKLANDDFLFTSGGLGGAKGVEAFEDDDNISPSVPDPMTNIGHHNPWADGGLGSGDDPWSNSNDELFPHLTLTSLNTTAGGQGMEENDWAKFDFDRGQEQDLDSIIGGGIDSGGNLDNLQGGDDEWASFESALPIPIPQEQNKMNIKPSKTPPPPPLPTIQVLPVEEEEVKVVLTQNSCSKSKKKNKKKFTTAKKEDESLSNTNVSSIESNPAKEEIAAEILSQEEIKNNDKPTG